MYIKANVTKTLVILNLNNEYTGVIVLVLKHFISKVFHNEKMRKPS